MIVDLLVLHHTYEGATAFDVSQHHHHGVLEHVGSGGGTVSFSGGPGCVRVPATRELKSLRAVRTSVRFRWDPTGPARRHNLIEGYLSFALVIDDDGALHGTILSRTGAWVGARSAPGTVKPGIWHTATFVHDGISACRLDLDGATVAESYDALGPVQGVQDPLGLAIGHWPNPDDRYSFEGEIDDVKVWVDRPDAIKDLVDSCCCDDRGKVDEAFAQIREDGLDAAAYRQAAEELYDIGRGTFGKIAAGTQADRDQAMNLTRRFALALGQSDRQAMADVVVEGVNITQAKVPQSELLAAGNDVVSALGPTVLGPLMSSVLGGQATTPQELEEQIAKLGLDRWMQGFCLDWVLPPRPPGRKPQRHPDHSTDPTTDHGPDGAPPSWGADGKHDDGDDWAGEPGAEPRRDEPGKPPHHPDGQEPR